jgi:hypothetical protein
MFVTNTVWGGVVVDIVCDPKVKLAGKSAIPEAIIEADRAVVSPATLTTNTAAARPASPLVKKAAAEPPTRGAWGWGPMQ